jgi:hypothetical protein
VRSSRGAFLTWRTFGLAFSLAFTRLFDLMRGTLRLVFGLFNLVVDIQLDFRDRPAGQFLDILDRFKISIAIDRKGAAVAPPRPVRPMRWT